MNNRLGLVIKAIPALCKVSQAPRKVVLVLPRAPEWAGAGLPLGQTGDGDTEGPRDLPKGPAQAKAETWVPELEARRKEAARAGPGSQEMPSK